ncbi:hypothetical protein ANCCAN_01643 [Ancylostoma caninum]|uniref:Uncharacterized protein n=1 Tax=Ancylostoma caninum TaxID=29170 RepID=A0A368H6H8_ANCCA|nr:hypothetical protein ANCCAN_01643 [Ancylostoma caninum]
MINVFNSPIEASTIDEFAEGRSDEEPVFEKRKRRPKVEYTADGRKLIDGVLEDEQTPDTLWTTAISRGVANDWRAKAEGGPFYRAKRYVSVVSYDVKVFVQKSMRHYGTAILLLLNFCLAVTICRLFKIL